MSKVYPELVLQFHYHRTQSVQSKIKTFFGIKNDHIEKTYNETYQEQIYQIIPWFTNSMRQPLCQHEVIKLQEEMLPPWLGDCCLTEDTLPVWQNGRLYLVAKNR